MQAKVAVLAWGTGGMEVAVCGRLAQHRANVTGLEAAAAQRTAAAMRAANGQTIAVDATGTLLDPDAA